MFARHNAQGMARPVEKHLSFQERMEKARGGHSYEDIGYAVRQYLSPAQWVSAATIRRLFLADEVDADPVLVWAVARATDQSLEWLSPIASAWFRSLEGHLSSKLTPVALPPGQLEFSYTPPGAFALVTP